MVAGGLEYTQNSQACHLLESPMRSLKIEILIKIVDQYEPEKQY